MKVVGITGSTGFVGTNFCDTARKAGWEVLPLRRSDLYGSEDRLLWKLSKCDWLVNCAGSKSVRNVQDAHVNEILPRHLLDMARLVGLQGMTHVSTVAAVTDRTDGNVEATDFTEYSRTSAYGESKRRGDAALLDSGQHQTKLCILRPPLLFGSEAKGIFGLLRRAASVGLPLPFAGLRNLRSVMYIQNFAHAIKTSIDQNVAGTYIATDSSPMTPEALYSAMLEARGLANRSFAIGQIGQALMTKLLGDRSSSLYSDASYNGARFTDITGIVFPFTFRQAIDRTMNLRRVQDRTASPRP